MRQWTLFFFFLLYDCKCRFKKCLHDDVNHDKYQRGLPFARVFPAPLFFRVITKNSCELNFVFFFLGRLHDLPKKFWLFQNPKKKNSKWPSFFSRESVTTVGPTDCCYRRLNNIPYTTNESSLSIFRQVCVKRHDFTISSFELKAPLFLADKRLLQFFFLPFFL